MKPLHDRLAPFAAALLGAASASVFAAGGAFKTYDRNSDGRISMEEYQARGGTSASFGAADADGDKRLSQDEFGKIGASGSGDTGYSGTSSSEPPMAPPSSGADR